MSAHDGGPAFPGTCREMIHPGHTTAEPQFADVSYPGMSIRDYFAAAAMAAILARDGKHTHADEGGANKCRAETARKAYLCADAMLAERDRGKP